MSSFLQWLSMGGYATYVWPAYGLVCGVLLLNMLSIKWQQKRTRKFLQHWFTRH